MCEKVRTYNKESVEICRNCRGTGEILTAFEKYTDVENCPVCKGSGRIKKTLNIEITIVPYAGECKT